MAAWLGIAVNSIKGDLIPTDAKSLGRYGLGQVYTFSIVQNIGGKTSNSTLLGCILFANVFQVVVNVVYQILLAQLTSMLVAREWLSYVCRPSCRKSVSSFSILIRKFRSSRVGKLFKISPDPLVSDRIQCQWIIEPFDNCRKLGLTSHWEAEIRKKFPNETSLLVAEAVLPEKLSDHELEKTSLLVAEDILPEGPSDHKLEKGDVLIKVNGELVTKFTRLDAILASSVRAGKLNLLVQRGGKDVKVELDVGYLPPGKTFRVSAPEGKQTVFILSVIAIAVCTSTYSYCRFAAMVHLADLISGSGHEFQCQRKPKFGKRRNQCGVLVPWADPCFRHLHISCNRVHHRKLPTVSGRTSLYATSFDEQCSHKRGMPSAR